jgi:hypothetical protein
MSSENVTPANYYVDNVRLYEAMKNYKAKVDAFKANVEAGIANDTLKPRVSEYIGSCIYLIANKLSLNKNFINYSFREEMIGDAIDNCIYYIDNFNPDKYNNPFAYFTQISYYAFIRRIQKEKKQLYIKHKAFQNASVNGLINQYQEGDDGQTPNVSDRESEYMDNLVIDFESKLKEKKKKAKKND